MKTRFSIGDAVGSPFRMVGRHPISIFVWGLVALIPTILGGAIALDMMGEIMVQAALEGPDAMPDMSRFMQQQSLSLALNLIQLAVCAVVQTGIYRAVFAVDSGSKRSDPAFFLRLGMDEIRVIVITLAFFLGIYVLTIVFALVGLAMGFALAQLAEPWNGISITILAISGMVGLVWLMLRVSLIAPASVMLKRFAFAEGWRMAKGQTWRLLGLVLVLTVILLVLYLAIAIVAVGIFAAVGVSTGWSDVDPATWSERLPQWQTYWPWLAVVLVPFAWIYGFLLNLFSAPFALAVQQIAGSITAEEPKDTPAPDALASH